MDTAEHKRKYVHPWSDERRRLDKLNGRPWRRNGRVKAKCASCGNEFEDYKSNHRKYCSWGCLVLSQVGRKPAHLFTESVIKKRNESVMRSRHIVSRKLSGRTRIQPSVAKGVEHNRAKHLLVSSPSRRIYAVDNVSHFVRSHPELFNPDDLIQYRSSKSFRCKASCGLLSLIQKGFHGNRSNARGVWKGWTLVEEMT